MYKQSEPNLWAGGLGSKTDSRKFGHFQTVTFEDLFRLERSSMPSGVGILDYAVNKGVALNKGRIGAKEGPDAIKQAFAGLPDLNRCETLIDYGNVYYDHGELIDTRKKSAMLATKSIANHRQTFLLGGGHDITYTRYLATRRVYPTQSIGAINVDAHFDTCAEQQPTSGTSFRQALEEDEDTDYLVLGIAQGGNTQSLFDYTKEKEIDHVFTNELLSRISSTIRGMIERSIHEHNIVIFVICMDVIDSTFAPGIGAPAALGLYPHTLLELAKRIIPSDKVSSVSIAKMNSTYDADNRTAKLVTNLVRRFLK